MASPGPSNATEPVNDASTEEGVAPSPKNGISLAQILSVEGADLSMPDVKEEEEGEEGGGESRVPEGNCLECEDQPAEVYCEDCAEDWCSVCFGAFHRKGNRKRHKHRKLTGPTTQKHTNGTTLPSAGDDKMATSDDEESEADEEEEEEEDAPAASGFTNSRPAVGEPVGNWFLDRARYIPLRLTLRERKFLRLLDAALQVSEYTDRIDTLGFGLSKAKRIVNQIRELCGILSGLVVASDFKLGQELFQDRNFIANAEFFHDIFELGRRHKIMNPEKMRGTYGQLMYLLMDSQSPEIQDMLGFSCVTPIRTVYSTLKRLNALGMLKDDLISAATMEVTSDGKMRHEIQRQIKRKERAIEALAEKYSTAELDSERIRQCLYSIGDNEAFLRVNRDPCLKMIGYLEKYFHPTKAEPGRSLAIRSGKNGARLSHPHDIQYSYCLQSLTLWAGICHDMFHLWFMAEDDLLSTRVPYRLRDTGQGLNRVQPAPATARLMHTILNKAQSSIGSWVGSSVIHMGDHNVPNSLMFIDKYTQVYRILLPICTTLSVIPSLMKNPAINKYLISEYGSIDELYVEILGDFFRHAFDGSGASNFFDAGSCIDGRLTSAWNWCSTIEKKKYFHVFLLTGFVGFDGQW